MEPINNEFILSVSNDLLKYYSLKKHFFIWQEQNIELGEKVKRIQDELLNTALIDARNKHYINEFSVINKGISPLWLERYIACLNYSKVIGKINRKSNLKLYQWLSKQRVDIKNQSISSEKLRLLKRIISVDC